MSRSRDRDANGPPKAARGEDLADTPSPLRGSSRPKPNIDVHVDTQPELQPAVKLPRTVDVGHIVGDRYRLVSRLGAGAMGDVFVAENLSIHLRVAVKLLKPELLADAVFRERFQQEAQAIAAIEHPNVARFLDLVVGDPTFLVMEYVRGQTLADRLRVGGPLALLDAVNTALRLCWALGAAHAAGIIHRDLKPSNVILAPDLEHGYTPKLIDFGLAKLAANVERSGLTRTGQVVGTPKYMAPEQIAGKPVDPRSDMYSLGCLLYEMVSGSPPFGGEDDVQVLYRQIHDVPDLLSKHAADVPAQLDRVVARVLDKDPAQRFATVAEFARALDAAAMALAGRSTSSQELYPVGEETLTQPKMGGSGARPAFKRQRSTAQLLLAGIAGVAVGLGATLGGLKLGHRKPLSTAGFLLLSEPVGANVILDGKPVGRPTPTWVPDVAPGPHTVRFEREGVAPVTQNLTLKDDERAVVQVSMPLATHRLEVRSQPDGASVFLDGRLAFGETPTYVDITDEDFHELRVFKNGYQTVIKPLTPDDKMPSMTVQLKPESQPRGTLVVDANNAAEVWIDGMNTGYTTPTLGIQVPLGKHLVELRDGNGQKGPSATVTVAQGQTLRLLLGAGAAPAPPAK